MTMLSKLQSAAQHSTDGAPAGIAETMLTMEAAAELMQCSLPYVAMLIDHGKLAGVSLAEDGQRRVPESSVRTWIEAHETKAAQADYRAAAAETGMYAVPEQEFIDVPTR